MTDLEAFYGLPKTVKLNYKNEIIALSRKKYYQHIKTLEDSSKDPADVLPEVTIEENEIKHEEFD